MFIELADHVRCPEAHAEQYLVLLPDQVEDRSVRSGDIGCPVCGRTFRIVDGVLDFGDGPAEVDPTSALDGSAAAALAGLSGPGGYLVLMGGIATRYEEIAAAMPGVGLAAVNPPPSVLDGAGISVLRGRLIPFKSSSMRAVLLGAGFGADTHWVREAMRVTLAGLRIVGEGTEPVLKDLEIMATAAGCWVGVKARNRM